MLKRRDIGMIALLTALLAMGWQSGQGRGPKDGDQSMELYGLFVDAVEQVEQNYVRPVSRRDLIEAGLRGVCETLDPHSSFISHRDWDRFRRQIEGSFGGIGIQVGIDEDTGRLRVIAPMVGTPAYKAGIISGDLILEVDGKATDGFNIDRAIDALQGRPGAPVKLKILHQNGKEAVDVSVTRAEIDVPSVLGDFRKADDSWDYLYDKENKIGYIRITSFIQRTSRELTDALKELKAQGFKGLILDLRDNPGGLLTSAVEVSDLFVEEGMIVSTKGRNVPDLAHKAVKEGTYTGFPMTVLVNGNSASAAEIVSACLQDHKRAKVVGSRSFGKGSVQNILELEDGLSVLKLTIATYFRPSNKNIHRFPDAQETDEWGVSPDKGLELKLAFNEYRQWALGRRDRDQTTTRSKPQELEKKLVDKQLEKALETVRAELKGSEPGKDKDKDKDKDQAKPKDEPKKG